MEKALTYGWRRWPMRKLCFVGLMMLGMAVHAIAADPTIAVTATPRYPWSGIEDSKLTIVDNCGMMKSCLCEDVPRSGQIPLCDSKIGLAGFILSIVCAIAAWHQWRRSCAVTRSEHLREMLESFKEREISETFYVCINNASYGGNGSDDPIFYKGNLRFAAVGHVDEGNVDNMLLRFSSICHDHHLGIISDEEFEFFSFQIRRTLAHIQIKRYLLDMAEYCGKYKCGYMFYDLVREGLIIDRPHYARAIELVEDKLFITKIFGRVVKWFNI